MKTLFFCVYYTALIFSAIYGLHRLILAVITLFVGSSDPRPLRQWDRLPRVTVQLPVYNEELVIERLLNAVGNLDYPRQLFQIQILDDSTDGTTEIARKVMDTLRSRDLDVELIRRQDRRGYKAGALAEGLKTAKGEYVAIFDADFLPPSDFLLRMIHHFTDPAVGMVQMRWGHDNAGDSFLTRLQSMLIDGHFVVDQVARYSTGRFFNFNGSAGIWRRDTIDSAGGWHSDTLSEDLDLSYRAQMKGWRFVFLSEKEVVQELPRTMIDFKSQQFRWAKGSLEVARKLLRTIWKAPLPLKLKVEATFHLTNNLGYALIVFLSLATLPAICMRLNYDWRRSLMLDLPLFLIGLGSVALYFIVVQKKLYPNWLSRIGYLPFFMGAIAGLSFVHLKAIWEVVRKKKTPFIRTPKYGKNFSEINLHKPAHALRDPMVLGELLMGCYITLTIVYAFKEHLFGAVPFMIIMGSGFFYVAFHSIFRSSPEKAG